MMRSTFSTPYDEEFAKRCIALKFPELKWNLTLQENAPPDLADTDNSVSVEVVSAVTEIDAELLNSYAKYSNYNVQELQPKLMKKINGDCSGFICDDEDNIVGASGAGSDDLCEVIKVRVIRKTKKLNSDRHPEFKTNCIFVYNPDRFCFEDGL